MLNKRLIKSSINFIARIIGIVNSILILKFLGAGKNVDEFVLTYAVYNYLINLVSPIIETQSTASFNSGENPSSINKSVNFINKYFSIVIVIAIVFTTLKFNIFYSIICMALFVCNYSAIYFGYAVHKENWTVIFWANVVRLIVSGGFIITLHSAIGIYSAIVGIMFADISKYIFLKFHFKDIFNKESNINIDFNKQVGKQISSHLLNGIIPLSNRYIAEISGVSQIIFLDLAEKIYSGTSVAFAHQYLPTKFNDWSALFINDPFKTKKIILKISWIIGFGGVIFSVTSFYIFWELDLLNGSKLTLPTLYYFLGLGPYLSTLVLVKLIILLKKTQVLSYVAILQIIVNIIVSFSLAPVLGLSGIAIAVTFGSLVTSISLWIYILTFKVEKVYNYGG